MIKNNKKNFFWNTLGSLVNSVTSLFFMIIVTRINGTDVAGVFAFAFSIACFFQVISNYAGRIYQVTEVDDSFSDTDFLIHKVITCGLMLSVSLVFILIKSYSFSKSIIIILFVVFRLIESVAEVFYAIIQKKEELYKVGISLFLKGFLGIFFFFIIDYLFKNIFYSIISLIFVNLLVTVFLDYNWMKPWYRQTKISKYKVKKIFKGGFFVFLFTFLTQYVLNAPKYAIDDYLNNQAQTIYGIIVMPTTVLILCGQFIVQPLLVNIAALVKEKKYTVLKKFTYKLLAILGGIGILGELCCYWIGIPFLEFIYGISLADYKIALLIVILGAVFYALSFIISTVLTTMRKTFIQIIFYGIVSLFIMVTSKLFVIKFGVLGASFAYCISMVLLFLMYFVYFTRRCVKNG